MTRIMFRPLGRVLFGLSALALALSFSANVFAGEFPVDNVRELRMMKAKVRAATFLSKATFGPNQEAIDELAERILQIGYKRAMLEWIDYQFSLPASSHQDSSVDMVVKDGRTTTTESVGISNYRDQAWSDICLRGEDQLRQRVAWALSQIFSVGNSGQGFNNSFDRNIGNGERSVADWIGLANYYDLFVKHADGSYRELLEDVTYHPIMGVWLSSVRNRKANIGAGRFPDENYAREIMQLFSVGLYKLRQDGRLVVDENGNLIPTYDNSGIKELARLFTGFKYHHNTSTSFYSGRNYGDPMRIHVSEHDDNENYSEEPNAPNSKTIFGVTLPPVEMTVPGIEAEIDAGLDVIANHPNVGPFVCRLLIQRLVKSNPSRAYMRRVTKVYRLSKNGKRGDLKEVVKAILTDPEVFRGTIMRRRPNPLRLAVSARGTEYGRLREPIIRVTSLIRAMRPTSNYRGGLMMFNGGIVNDLGQMAYRNPTVFNFYLPDHQPPGELIGYTPSRKIPREALFAPEFQILNGVTSNRTLNRLRNFAINLRTSYGMRRGNCTISFHLEPEIELAQDINNLDEVLRRFDLWLCNGTLSEETKTSIKNAVIAETDGRVNWGQQRVEEMLAAVLYSPDCAIEQ